METRHWRAIVVNGAPVATGAVNLGELVIELGFADARVATALNGDFVPGRVRGSTLIQHGDTIEIVSARHGG